MEDRKKKLQPTKNCKRSTADFPLRKTNTFQNKSGAGSYACETWKITKVRIDNSGFSQTVLLRDYCLSGVMILSQMATCPNSTQRNWVSNGRSLRWERRNYARGALNCNPQGTTKTGHPKIAWQWSQRKNVLEGNSVRPRLGIEWNRENLGSSIIWFRT